MIRWIEAFNSNSYNINPQRIFLLKVYLDNLCNGYWKKNNFKYITENIVLTKE